MAALAAVNVAVAAESRAAAAPRRVAASATLGPSAFVGRQSLASLRVSIPQKSASSLRLFAVAAAGEAPPAVDGKLYVGNLPWHVDAEMLGETFQTFGAVQQCDVVYDRESGRSRGFGFVTMSSKTEAEAAIAGLDGKEMDGRPVKVNFPQPAAARGERPPRTERPAGGAVGMRTDRREGGAPVARRREDNPNKLYVGNLSWGMDDVQLEDLFAEFGGVAEAKVVLERETGRSRGFGFVTMGSETEVAAAIAQLDGQDVDGRVIRVRRANEDRPQ